MHIHQKNTHTTQGAPVSREASFGGLTSTTTRSDEQRANAQPRRKRLRLTLANDQEAAWHGFVVPATEAAEEEEEGGMLLEGQLEVDGMMRMCVEGEGEELGEGGMAMGGEMGTQQRRGREGEQQSPAELPNSLSAIERFNRSNSHGQVHPAAG